MKKFLCYDTNDAASGKINVSTNGVLSPNATVPSTNGASYQQLVTDDDGNAKWEDRLAYDDSKLIVDVGEVVKLIKVADEVPSWATVNAPMKVWVSNGTIGTVPPEGNTDLGNGSFAVGSSVVITTTDILEFDGLVFPEKGVYFAYSPEQYVTGIASADSDTPEITWDGSLGEIKKIDEKFIPDIPADKLPDIPVIEFNQSIAETIESSSQPSYVVSNFNYSELLNIFNRKNFLIKDTEKYYSPSDFSIFNGNLSIAILVLPKGSDNHLCYTHLTCNKNTNRFHRNNYWIISATKA